MPYSWSSQEDWPCLGGGSKCARQLAKVVLSDLLLNLGTSLISKIEPVLLLFSLVIIQKLTIFRTRSCNLFYEDGSHELNLPSCPVGSAYYAIALVYPAPLCMLLLYYNCTVHMNLVCAQLLNAKVSSLAMTGAVSVLLGCYLSHDQYELETEINNKSAPIQGYFL
ncbi:hypothetical protein ABZP36_019537 [Zizania latifolia]